MTSARRTGWDPLAAIAAASAVVMLGVYIGLTARQDGRVAVWFVAGLSAAAFLAIYGVARRVPRRGWALAVSGAVMVALGFVSLPSIGSPILCAGVLALVAALRAGRIARTRPLSDR